MNIADKSKKFAILMIGLLCVMSPIGIGLGRLMEKLNSNGIVWVMYSLASGSFIYVSTIEILSKLFSKKNKGGRSVKLLSVASGIFVIAIAQLQDN